METDEITSAIIDSAIRVHRALGPGMLEHAYEACLAFELGRRGLVFERQKPAALYYEGHSVDCGFRIDLFVEDQVVVEIKAIERWAPIHTAQMISYLRVLDRPVGLLINFNVPLLRDGIRRVVDRFDESRRLAARR